MLAAYAAYVMVQAGLPFRHLWLNGGRWDAVNWTAQVRYWNDTSERMKVMDVIFYCIGSYTASLNDELFERRAYLWQPRPDIHTPTPAHAATTLGTSYLLHIPFEW
jgi:hypothetical protein